MIRVKNNANIMNFFGELYFRVNHYIINNVDNNIENAYIIFNYVSKSAGYV